MLKYCYGETGDNNVQQNQYLPGWMCCLSNNVDYVIVPLVFFPSSEYIIYIHKRLILVISTLPILGCGFFC